MEGTLLQQIQDMYYYADLQRGKWVNNVIVNFSILFWELKNDVREITFFWVLKISRCVFKIIQSFI